MCLTGGPDEPLENEIKKILRRSQDQLGISGEALLVYNFVHINLLWSGFISPRIRTQVEKRFHGLFSEKKRSKSGGVP